MRDNIAFLAAQGAVALDGKLPAPMPYGLTVNGAAVSDVTHEFVIGPDAPTAASDSRVK